MVLAHVLILLAGEPDFHGEISERLTRRPNFVLTTPKALPDLEFCVADMASNLGAPSVVHDGASRTVVVAWNGKAVMGIVDLRRAEGTTTISGYFQSMFDGRMRSAIGSCL